MGQPLRRIVEENGREFERSVQVFHMECSTNWPRRLLISQDSYKYTSPLRHLSLRIIHDEQQSNRIERSFMIMTQCGPWNIRNQKHMSHLFTLNFCLTSDNPFV